MKNTNVLLIFALFSFNVSAIDMERNIEICKKAAISAEEIMIDRQDNLGMVEVMDGLKNSGRGVINFVIEAYKVPRYSTLEAQKKAILEFKNQKMLDCMLLLQKLELDSQK